MAEKKKNRAAGGIAAAGLIGVLIYFSMNGASFGFGTGNTGTADATPAPEQTQETETESPVEDTKTVTITISEDSVTVGDHVCADADEFKAYIEEIYSDDLLFVLEDDNAILSTYEWVSEACTELGISLKE